MPFGDMISTTTGASCVLPPSITAGLTRTFSGRAWEQTPPPPHRHLGALCPAQVAPLVLCGLVSLWLCRLPLCHCRGSRESSQLGRPAPACCPPALSPAFCLEGRLQSRCALPVLQRFIAVLS